MKKYRAGKKTLARNITVSLFISTMAAFFIGIAVIYNSMYSKATDMNSSLNISNLDVTADIIEQQIKSVEEALLSFFIREDVRRGIINGERSLEDISFFNSMNTAMTNLRATITDINAIAIYRVNGESLLTVSASPDSFHDYESCLEYFRSRGASVENLNSTALWVPNEQDPSLRYKRPCFVNLRLLRNTSTGEPSAVIAVYYDERAVSGVFSSFGSKSLLINDAGLVTSAADKSMIGAYVGDSELFGQMLASRKRTVPINGELMGDYIDAFCTWLPSLGGYLVAVPDENLLEGINSSTVNVILILIATGALMSLAASVILSRGITKPISSLTLAMEKVRAGDFDVRYHGKGASEAVFLGNTFNMLMDEINRYIVEIKREERKKTENEIKFLQSQINPHLLYNTLDSAIYYASRGDYSTATQTLRELSGFFKLSLRKGDLYAPLRTEIQHIQRYMEIQRLCRGKDIALLINCDERLLDAYIVKTTLQPIVENAYMHAFEGSVNDGRIALDASVTDNVLHISVTDNGMGMDDQTLLRLNAGINGPVAVDGFGLWNVSHRIRACYGEGYGMSVHSEFGEYTRVCISVPLRLGNQQDG